MEKIFVVAGVIIICLLVLGGWFFVGGLGGWSQLLGQKSKGTYGSDETKFVGTWDGAASFGSITFSMDGVFRKGVFDGTWKLESSQLQLFGLDGVQSWASYSYSFSNAGGIVTLTELKTGQRNVLTKQ